MDNEELDELVKDIEKRGVRGMRWGHRKREFRQASTDQLLNILGSLESRAHHQQIGRLIMQELKERPGGMAAFAASQRRAEEEHKRRWGKK